jgi:hypothetical protein
MGQVLHRSATTTAAIRRAIQHSQERLRALARCHGINPKDGGQVEEAQFHRRSSDWTNSSPVHRLVRGAGGRHRCVSQAHASATRWLFVRLASHDSATDSLVTAPLLRTAWHQPAAGGGRRQAHEEEVRQLSRWLLSYRPG